MPPRPGNQHVLDVLPECLVLPEVGYRRRLAAFFVGEELDAGHGRCLLGSCGSYSHPYQDSVSGLKCTSMPVSLERQRCSVKAHQGRVPLPFIRYNSVRVHKPLQITPAMAAGITDHVWSLEEIAMLADEAFKPRKAGRERKRALGQG